MADDDTTRQRAQELVERAGVVLADVDARLAALAEIERRSAAMVDAQRHSPLRRP